MNKKQILIIGDSLACPRKEVPLEETYYYMLHENFIDRYIVINNAQRFYSSTDLLNKKLTLFDGYNPNIVIISIGLVDSFPRFLPQNELFVFFTKILSLLKIDLRKIFRFLKIEYFVANKFNFKIVNKHKFKNNISDLLKYLEKFNTKIIFLGIACPGIIIKKKLPILEKEIEEYNQFLRDLKNNKKIFFINNDDILETDFTSDSQHFNKFGHKKVFNKILNLVEKIDKGF